MGAAFVTHRQFAAEIEIPGELAWKLFTKGLTTEQIAREIRTSGDLNLAQPALTAKAIVGSILSIIGIFPNYLALLTTYSVLLMRSKRPLKNLKILRIDTDDSAARTVDVRNQNESTARRRGKSEQDRLWGLVLRAVAEHHVATDRDNGINTMLRGDTIPPCGLRVSLNSILRSCLRLQVP